MTQNSFDSAVLTSHWRHRDVFTMLELRRDARHIFVQAWRQWRSDSPEMRCSRLHFVAAIPEWQSEIVANGVARIVGRARIETGADTHTDVINKSAFDSSETDIDSEALNAAWPPRIAGVHRLEFENGQVTLTLYFGSIVDALSECWLRADRIGIDAPDPADQSEIAFAKGIARLAAEGASVEIGNSSAAFEKALQSTGFETDGLSRYRFAPKWRVRRYEPPAPAIAESAVRHRQSDVADVMIIGAGMAGCALAERLASRGLRVAIVDAADRPASGASGNPAGVFHPVMSNDDSLASRATRAGFLYALRHWMSLESRGFGFNWRSNGLVQVASDVEEEAALHASIRSLGLPDDLARYVTAEDAYSLIGIRPAFGGVFYAHGGLVDPASLCSALLEAAQASTSISTRFNCRIDRLEHENDLWSAIDSEGQCVARASIAVIANANDASRLARLDYAPTVSIRGQLTWLDNSPVAALRLPLIGDGYVLPPDSTDGRQLTGASYELDDADPTLRPQSQRENIERLARLVPDAARALRESADDAPLAGRVAFRCASSDRMPLIGALADEQLARENADRLTGAWPLDLPRRNGLYGAYGYGSRGLTWASLGAEIIASQILGEPLPVDRHIADAFDPARFLMRALRQREVR